MIPGSASPLLLKSAAAAAAPVQIERSLRFNSSDSAFLSRTPAVAGNRRTWTWAGWVKRSALGSNEAFFEAKPASGGWFALIFDSNNRINIGHLYGISQVWSTNAVFRDLSAWYHIVAVCDTTSATSTITGTATDRLRLYVNGTQQSLGVFGSPPPASPPAQNADLQVNDTVPHYIGRYSATTSYSNFYLADIHFIDGQALTPSSFTEVSATTGQLIPKTYAGTYTGNSFWLKFNDNSAATATTLGKDSFLLGNNWTPNNLSVTAGAGNDSLVDTPTSYGTDTGAGGVVRGNYCTWNPLRSLGSLLNGNLDHSNITTNFEGSTGTIYVSSGKWYWEWLSTASVSDTMIGISTNDHPLNSNYSGSTTSWTYFSPNGQKHGNGANGVGYGASWGNGDLIGIALDMDANSITFYKNGVSQGVAFSTGIAGKSVTPLISSFNTTGAKGSANFGQRAFAYAAPSGFKALCDTNIPEGTITTSGTFTGNASADGPFVYLNGVPTAMTINSNAVTFATHADKLSNGFKLRTSSGSYNTAGSNSYSITTTGAKFKYARAQPNP